MFIFFWITVSCLFDLLGICVDIVQSTEENEVMANEDQVTMEESVFDFPFLNDPETIKYVGTSQTLLLLRGPPGSGKSTLAEAINKKYPGKVAICSAQQHIPQGKKPPFSKQILENAHSDCHQCVRDACSKSFSIVIVDNTNAALDAVKNYTSIGHDFDYVDVLVAPQTSWILNAQVLVKKSSRGFSLKDIQKKVEKFQKPVYPLFYGWFVNRSDSERMREFGKMFYERCLSKMEFRDEFAKHLIPDASGKKQDPENYFSSENYTVGHVMLHCTAFYSNYGEVSQSEEYAAREVVRADNGKAFTIKVIGLLVTPRSLGFRLELNDEELPLWLEEDEVKDRVEESVDDTCASASRETCKPSGDECIITRLSPTCGTGSRAHFSLGSGPGVEAVQTGLDLVEIIKMEQEAVRMKKKHTNIGLEGATAVGYGEGNWMVYFDQASSTEALFAGYF
ncbi:2',3'-cyclic-nucleotide 3'-phosphodiesterase-like isoform X2 [Lytechinus variegatus]|uniref:2',3'-cyclic-nucleotide 3'-phosphodiesterase-like isoform X2 n=1 Tax=Lytechinus variegatus TaxID=7654 RepID=UPI001BB1926D|nr:2',3'-cyclic-nucleotide 3'-phosphodiesterase-like isoform X2 [Lytechinus variegatus]